MDPFASLTAAQQRFLEQQPVARLATVDSHSRPHLVPVCFAFDGRAFYSAVDLKPKQVAAGQLRRLKNINANPSVCLLVDHYDSDWALLCWLQVRGEATLLSEEGERQRAIALLRAKYPQYRQMALEGQPIIKVRPLRIVAWGDFTEVSPGENSRTPPGSR